jgi:hypothetical protein
MGVELVTDGGGGGGSVPCFGIPTNICVHTGYTLHTNTSSSNTHLQNQLYLQGLVREALILHTVYILFVTVQ